MDPALAALIALAALAAAGLGYAIGSTISVRRERTSAAAERIERVAAAERELLNVLGGAINEALFIVDDRSRVRYANAIARTWFAIPADAARSRPDIASASDIAARSGSSGRDLFAGSDRLLPLKSILRSAELFELLESLPPVGPESDRGGRAADPDLDSDRHGRPAHPDPESPIEHTLTHHDHVYRARLQRMADGGAVISLRDDTEVERLARARRELVANISHDLRTPLTSIRLLVDSLLESYPVPAAATDPAIATARATATNPSIATAPATVADPAIAPAPADPQRARIAGIRDQAAILERIADGLVQLNRLETGRALLQLTAHPLAEVVATAVQAVEPQLAEHRVIVETDVPGDLMVLIDEPQIIRVLTNLLDNALKASRPGRRVVVGVAANPSAAPIASAAVASGDRPVVPSAAAVGASSAAQRPSIPSASPAVDPDHVEIYVQDEGPGISPDDAERIFERFYRGDRARSSRGTGLGLAIARHIVEGHGGRIWLDRDYRDGARFRFTVPLARRPSPHRPTRGPT